MRGCLRVDVFVEQKAPLSPLRRRPDRHRRDARSIYGSRLWRLRAPALRHASLVGGRDSTPGRDTRRPRRVVSIGNCFGVFTAFFDEGVHLTDADSPATDMGLAQEIVCDPSGFSLGHTYTSLLLPQKHTADRDGKI